ncbi:MAG: hypothetical protein ACYCQK_01445 [Acidiferrobacteraceae bacterium]
MAKERYGDSNKIRDEEREVETRAAFAGKGDSGDDAGDDSMPRVTRDGSQAMAQRAADDAARFNDGDFDADSSGTEEMEDYD